MFRTHTCGELRISDVNSQVTLSGWVQRSRKMGGMTFIDLRDRYGITQLVFNEEVNAELCEQANKLGREFVIQVIGTVNERFSKNSNIPTGDIEIIVSELNVLNVATTPPFTIEENTDGGDDIRMKYRYLDLRRSNVRSNLELRHKMTIEVRKYLDEQGFIEVETPVLVGSTPEGARDFVVPSRMNPGQFYALPQSPQTLKQLLMVAGFDRYFQIAKCFRDEDLRADRQPEFTQVDIETSFLNEVEIRALMEELIRAVFKEAINVDLPNPFPIMLWTDAMNNYGSDKPDLRVKLKLTDLTDLMSNVDFKVFRSATELNDGRVMALRVPHGASMPRSEIDGYTEFVKIYGAKGLAYIKVNDIKAGREGLQSPIVKNLSDDVLKAIIERTGAQDGDVIFFGADRKKIVFDSLGALRLKVGHSEFGKSHGLFEEGWRPLWVIDFPMFEYDEEEERWVACHHPFTSPKDGDEDKLVTDPENCFAKAYDMVLNGWEIGGGSIRIHKADVQSKVFNALKIGPEEARAKFGFLLDVLQYGAPPHGGLAFGLDRIVTMMCGADSIRDVIAFPKTQRAQCLLTQAPSPVDEKQLRELHIRLRNEHKKE